MEMLKSIRSSSSSAILSLKVDDPTSQHHIDLLHPILSVCRLPKDQFLAVLDVNRGNSSTTATESHAAVVLQCKHGKLELVSGLELARALSAVSKGKHLARLLITTTHFKSLDRNAKDNFRCSRSTLS